MPSPINLGTRDVPLQFAKRLTEVIESDKSFLEKITPVTLDLLRFWFDDVFCDQRRFNFHQGQKQAIINTIYVHEVLKSKSVFQMYESIDLELLSQMLADIKKPKYQFPKYAIKMATGTGKTWVIQALLIWQYLNAKHEDTVSGAYSKNFLIVAPGLMVYERLLDAFLGKEHDGKRDFGSSDFAQYHSLFIPDAYKQEVFGFIQSSVCSKEEIGSKATADGLVAITNWHLLVTDKEEKEEASPLENPAQTIEAIRPLSPGISAGNSLESLDRQYLQGGELEFLRNLPDLVVVNDEAHHIHENKSYDQVEEVEWQKSLNLISETKGNRFIQVDFSATPYDVTGSGQKRTKHYFPHIVCDFDLKTAIRLGLVKTIALDKRKELASEALEFRAERENGKVLSLSQGQKIMLRAGIAKLRNLEKHFTEFDAKKHPKMFVICEDTSVSPLVVDFLVREEGLANEDVIQIDSDRKGSIKADEWSQTKELLFNIDKHEKPKVIVSVLMLREGFDVSNICVIVPLRSSQAPILLEQTVGRGLRLMWREPEYRDEKQENLEKMLVRKEQPKSYLDILSIVEHPAFIEFYDDLFDEITVVERDPSTREDVLGDLMVVGLKPNYEEYDLFFPIIISDREEDLVPMELPLDGMQKFEAYSLGKLKTMVPKGGDVFVSEELLKKARFGDYEVRADLFTAKSYNEFIGKIVRLVSEVNLKVSERKHKIFPVMQINQAAIARAVDQFIRTKLFGGEFDPFKENHWRVLLLMTSGITEHIVRQVGRAVYDLQKNINVDEAKVVKKYFSEMCELKMRKNFALQIQKTIYEFQSYPSNKGLFEKAFMEYVDGDSAVERLIKINEHYHDFARIPYVRNDGMLSSYSPDFMVKTNHGVFLVETKADEHLSQDNVRLKRLAAVDWVDRVNQTKPEDRMNAEWKYVLLSEKTFERLRDSGGSVQDIFNYCELTTAKTRGNLF